MIDPLAYCRWNDQHERDNQVAAPGAHCQHTGNHHQGQEQGFARASNLRPVPPCPVHVRGDEAKPPGPTLGPEHAPQAGRGLEDGHHSRELRRLTGLEVQENQARRLLNDIAAFGAYLIRTEGRPVHIGASRVFDGGAREYIAGA